MISLKIVFALPNSVNPNEMLHYYADFILSGSSLFTKVHLIVHRYSVDKFSYSGPSGILGSEGNQNTS